MTLEEKLQSIFDPILKPNMVNSWNRQWKQYFVTEDTVEDKRCPGKMKRKFVKSCLLLLILQLSLTWYKANS